MRRAGDRPGAAAPPPRPRVAEPPVAPAAVHAGWRLAGDALVVAVGGTAATVLLEGPTAPLAALWLIAVVVVVRTDLDRFIIPDTASLAIAVLGLAEAVLRPGEDRVPAALLSGLAGGAGAFASFWLFGRLYRRAAGREGLGFGDVKLAGACGIWLTVPQQAAVLEIACLAALAATLLASGRAASRRTAVPFGAFLAPAAWLVFVAGPAVEGWMT